MKNSIKYLTIFAFAICAIFAASFFAGNAAATAAPTDSTTTPAENYINFKGNYYTDSTAGSADNISITVDSSSLVSYVKVTVSDWTNIKSFKIKRIVQDIVKDLEKDDSNLNAGSGLVCNHNTVDTMPLLATEAEPTVYCFVQNGSYVIEYDIEYFDEATSENKIAKRAVYLKNEFARSVDLSLITFTGATKVYTNTAFGSDTANIVVATDGSVTPNVGDCNTAIYALNYSPDEITSNNNWTLTIKDVQNVTLSTHIFEIYCCFPTLSFKNSNGVVVSDVFNGISSPLDTDGYLFFNERVNPTLNFSNLEAQEQIDQFNNRFELVAQDTYNDENTKINCTAKILLKTTDLINNEKEVFAQKYKIQTNPSEDISIKLGTSTSTITYPSENLSTTLNTIYSRQALYPASADGASSDNFKTIPTISEINSSQIGSMIIYKTDGDKVIFAYKLNYIIYDQNNATIEISSSDNTVTIKKPSNITVPVDLTIINKNNTSQRFTYENIFKNAIEDADDATKEYVKIAIKEAGYYKFIVKYRGSTETEEQNVWNHKTQDISISEKIQILSANQRILNGQITNNIVTVSDPDGEQYSITYNSETTEYSSTQILTEEGYYELTYGNSTYCFTIISSQPKNAYLASSYPQGTLKSITKGESNIPVSDSTKLTESGIYELTYSLVTLLPITINDGETQSLESTSEFTYNIAIQSPTFVVKANVTNGQKTSANVVIDSIESNGESTIKITHNNKTTTYSLEQFNSLSKKARTFSGTGIYEFLITDASGNQSIFSFEKYYKMNAALIILIGVAILLVAAVLVIILRLRLKSRVK